MEETNAKEQLSELKPEKKKDKILSKNDAFGSTVNVFQKMFKDPTSEDSVCLFKMIRRMESDGGEIKFSPWNQSTEGIKQTVAEAAVNTGIYNLEGKQMFFKMILTQLYQELKTDKAWQEFQDQVNKASQMPEQMDFYGSVIYDHMVIKPLQKIEEIKDKNPDASGDIAYYEKVAKIYIDNYFLIKMIGLVSGNYGIVRKAGKKIKNIITDIEFFFDKYEIKTTKYTRAAFLYKLMEGKYGFYKTCWFMAGLSALLDHLNTEKDKTVRSESVFLQSLIAGCIAYISDNKETRTDWGNRLIENVTRYWEICEIIENAKDPTANLDEQIGEYITKSISSSKGLYDKAVEDAKKAYEESKLSLDLEDDHPSDEQPQESEEETVADTQEDHTDN